MGGPILPCWLGLVTVSYPLIFARFEPLSKTKYISETQGKKELLAMYPGIISARTSDVSFFLGIIKPKWVSHNTRHQECRYLYCRTNPLTKKYAVV